MSDLDFQKLSSVQSSTSFGRTHITAVGAGITIAPETFLTIISNIGTIATITPPIDADHMLCLVFNAGSPGGFIAGGNINAAPVTASTGIPLFAVYDRASKLYHVGSTVDDQT